LQDNNMMTHSIRILCLAAAFAAVPVGALAAQTPVMTFEEFASGATNVDGFYNAGVSWVNEEVFNSFETPSQSPFAGPDPAQRNVLTRIDCDACELELLSTSDIDTITLSGLISGGPNLEIRAFSASGQQVGGNLVVDTEQESVGCAIPTDWSCNRTFDFAPEDDIRRLQFITSGTAVIDNVQITTFGDNGGSVPEPATLALAALGLLGAAAGRRRSNG
jgi:hypothetical protein